MRRFGLVCMLLSLAGAAHGQTGTPTAQERAAFRARYEDRVAACERDATERQLPANVRAFCRCQLDVFAENFTRQEMAATNAISFGRGSDEESRIALAAVQRTLPERERRCGF